MLGVSLLLGFSCAQQAKIETLELRSAQSCINQLNQIGKQMEGLLDKSIAENRIPRTLNKDGEMHWTGQNFDWTEGFFPGSLWLLYEFEMYIRTFLSDILTLRNGIPEFPKVAGKAEANHVLCDVLRKDMVFESNVAIA